MTVPGTVPASTSTVFTGWPTDATAFLAAIARDNTAEFWAAHRHRYTASVLPPLRALAAALEPEFGPVRILRPHRNRRFRPDAEPYRTDAGGVAGTAGGTELSVVLSAAALTVQVGRFTFAGEALACYRAAVAAESGIVLAALLDGLAADGFTVVDGPALIGHPRGYRSDHPRIALLRLRSLYVRRSWPVGEWLGTHEPLARVAGAWRAARPLAAWLDAHASS